MFRRFGSVALLTLALATPVHDAAAQDALGGALLGGVGGAIVGGAIGRGTGAVVGPSSGPGSARPSPRKASGGATIITLIATAASASAATAPGFASRRVIATERFRRVSRFSGRVDRLGMADDP